MPHDFIASFCQDGSAGKGTFCQSDNMNLIPRTHIIEQRQTPESCLLTCKSVPELHSETL